jgi:predicted anti-sigma-YlaC factor YlaD
MTAPSCDTWREAISAALDDEEATIAPALVAAHLRTCPECQAFQSEGERLRRLARLGPAVTPDPEQANRITEHVRASDALGSWLHLRIALAVVAAQILILALPQLWSASGGHGARHAFSFTLTYAMALVLVAWRPARARTVLPIAVVLAISVAVTAALDTAQGDTSWLSEAVHLPEFTSPLLVWRLARPPQPRPSTGDDRRRLHLVRGLGDRHRSDTPRSA